MAYYVHCKDQTIETAISECNCVCYTDAATAHQIRKAGELLLNGKLVPSADLVVSFWLDYDERRQWQRRERNKFQSAVYMHVPWHDEDQYPDHFAHLSLKTPGLVAYTENDEKGYNDRQTSVRPGKYLAQYYPDLSKSESDRLIAACVSDLPVLETTTDPKMCERVYTQGPRSCMSRPASAYRGHIHPAQVYGGSPDLALAFVRDQNDTDRFLARCIVWPDRRLAVRVYPDQHPIMLRLLENAGYDTSKARRDDCYNVLRGARIRAIEDRNDQGFILGYVDGIDCAEHVDQYLVLGSGSLSTHATIDHGGDTIAAGVTDPHEDDSDENDDEPAPYDFTCESCGEGGYTDDEGGSTENGETYCGYCWRQNVRTCAECGESYNRRNEAFVQMQNGDHWCEDCASNVRIDCAIETCGNDWINDQEFTDDEQRARQDRNVHELCSHCADQFEHCRNCDGYTAIGSLACEECNSLDIDRVPSSEPATLPIGDTTPTASPITLYRLEVMHNGIWTMCTFGSVEHHCISHDMDLLLARKAQLETSHPTCDYRIVVHVTATASATVTLAQEDESCAAF